MTTATATTASMINDSLKLCTGYAKMLLEDIPAEQFTHMPRPGMNHPAFCIGHLAIIPDMVLGLIGFGDRATPREGWQELFGMGSQCLPDADHYPTKDELVAYYFDRHAALAKALDEVDDAILRRESEGEGRFKDMCPTVGSAVNFLSAVHHMTHLGQISAWRRAVGMGPAMDL